MQFYLFGCVSGYVGKQLLVPCLFKALLSYIMFQDFQDNVLP